MQRIVVISNRVPSPDGQAVGGLAVGLRAALETSGGIWLGWTGETRAAPEGVRILRTEPFTLAGIDLADDEVAGYYAGFSNRVLWPLLHGRLDLVSFDAADFETYAAVNARFASAATPLLRDGDGVWVHDYHLMLAGRELRQRGVAAPLGFFLHVPFPPADVFGALPRHAEIFEALASYDLVGLQTENDLRNLREFVVRHLDGTVADDGTVTAAGCRFRAGVFPISIDTRRFVALARSREVADIVAPMAPAFHERFGIVGVERLDYTKGLAHRIRAFEWLLATEPGLRGRAFLVQVAAPSRASLPEYAALKDELARLTGEINCRYADVDWMPVRYINRAVDQSRLAAFYRMSRVGLVTPLRDGMNLVAKEYVAAQDADDPGVLVLSRFAGAAERLDGALLVNPYDVEDTAAAMREALVMALAERRDRWAGMMAEIERNDVHAWRDGFLAALATVSRSARRVPRAIAVTSVVRRPLRAPRPAAGGRHVPIGEDAWRRRLAHGA